MIRDPEAWRAFEAEWQQNTPVDPSRHFQIFDLLLEIARDLGAWPPRIRWKGSRGTFGSRRRSAMMSGSLQGRRAQALDGEGLPHGAGSNGSVRADLRRGVRRRASGSIAPAGPHASDG